ncbi:MAG: hypothetical protein LC105_00170 [Chitinophagales bacterium]|nr:hypothetical protein [Chitinophagales bacterium]MCZ2392259.1 hypothetical protein [Chitinophagales bacterium]
MKKILTSILLFSWCFLAFAQGVLKGGTSDAPVEVKIELGNNVLPDNLNFIQSVTIEPGTVLVLFEKYSNGKTSGRHRLITANDLKLDIGFKCKFAIAFSNPQNLVVGFEEINFSGKSMTFNMGRNEIPEGMNISSIYVPASRNIKLYIIDPALYPEQEVEHRPMGAGIRPYIGIDMAKKVKYIYVE